MELISSIVHTDILSSRSAHVGFASPTMLDPDLATNSYEAVINRYNARKAEIMQELRENEHILSSFMNEYRNRFSNSPTSRTRSSAVEQQLGFPSYKRQDSNSEGSRPLALESPTQARRVSSTKSGTWDGQVPPLGVGVHQSLPQTMIRSNDVRPIATLPSQSGDTTDFNDPRLQEYLQEVYELNSGARASTVSGTTIVSTARPTVAKKVALCLHDREAS